MTTDSKQAGSGIDFQSIDARCHDPYLRCALYGAAQTALGFTGCCVVAHSPQGCFQLVGTAFGWQNADYTETLTLCTKLCEDEIVHGGEEMLERTIIEAQVLDAPILFVITACGPEIVGDDVVAVCDNLRSRMRFPIIPIQCAGFRGDQNQGVDIALEAILTQLASVDRSGHRLSRSVVLVAPHANANPTWIGDLVWVREMISRMGGTVLAILTHDTTLEEIQKVPLAEGCIVLSHDAGQKAADYLSQQYGIEQWCRGLPLPIGFTNTRNWLTELGRRLNVEQEVDEIIAQGETLVVETCRRRWLEQTGFHRASVGVVADATVGIPLLRFITEDLEMIPGLVCLRSGQVGTRELVESELAGLGLDAKLLLNTDVYRSKMALADVRPEIVLGSNIERHAIEELDIPFMIELVNPIRRFRMIDRAYMGYTGMLNLIETIQNDWMDRYRSKRRRYKARW